MKLKKLGGLYVYDFTHWGSLWQDLAPSAANKNDKETKVNQAKKPKPRKHREDIWTKTIKQRSHASIEKTFGQKRFETQASRRHLDKNDLKRTAAA